MYRMYYNFGSFQLKLLLFFWIMIIFFLQNFPTNKICSMAYNNSCVGLLCHADGYDMQWMDFHNCRHWLCFWVLYSYVIIAKFHRQGLQRIYRKFVVLSSNSNETKDKATDGLTAVSMIVFIVLVKIAHI